MFGGLRVSKSLIEILPQIHQRDVPIRVDDLDHLANYQSKGFARNHLEL